MFDIAFSELVVIGIVALVVLGPKRLPEVARGAGRWAARIRRFIEGVKRDMDGELHREGLSELRKVQQEFTDTKQLLEQTASSTLAAIPEIRPPDLQIEPPMPVADAFEGASPEPARPAKRPATKKATRRAKAAKPKSVAKKRSKHGRATRKSR
jgi:sec-independent protein translocase protein TatB